MYPISHETIFYVTPPPKKQKTKQKYWCHFKNYFQVQHLIATTLSRFGKLDFLINNGGGQFPGPAESFSLKGWNAVIETNLTGTFLCCREGDLIMHNWFWVS